MDGYDAVVVVDVQIDFCPGGALAVADGDAVVAPANAALRAAPIRVLTQDWHPAGHSSFANTHPGKSPYERIEMPYGPQVLWPDHCIQGSTGAAFHPELEVDRADVIVRKGFRPEIDSYSAFFENDHATPTGLDGYLRTRGARSVLMLGLATDFCVGFSALDGAACGFDVTVDLSASRAIDLDGSLDTMAGRLREAGVTLIGD